MTNNYANYFYTTLVSGLAYFYTYNLISDSNFDAYYGILAFTLGVLAYLLIRGIYRSDQELNKVLAQAYRLLIILVPLGILSVKLVVYFFSMDVPPKFVSFYSAEDLRWSSIFIIILWPLLNLIVLLENISIAFWALVFYFGLILLTIIDSVILIIIINLYKKLIQLKQETVIGFSLTKATLQVVTPLIIFMVINIVYSRG